LAELFDSAPVRDYLLGLQRHIVGAFEAEDGKAFLSDGWTRPQGGALEGDGLSRLVEQGHVFERAGCNFSHVRGRTLPPSATQHRPELAGAPFEALGVSLVMHPRNPHVPTVHMNVRMFAALPAGQPPVSWFGGGMDLTPYYGVEEDAKHFHRCCRDALAPFGEDKYPRFKQWCDEYFFLKHRGEARGVGGVFFDDFAELGFERSFAMMRAVGDAFVPPTCRSCSAAVRRRTASASAISSSTAVGAMSSSTWSSTAAPISGCKAAGVPKAF
jgi:coproporphyrinogen III oxidase